MILVRCEKWTSKCRAINSWYCTDRNYKSKTLVTTRYTVHGREAKLNPTQHPKPTIHNYIHVTFLFFLSYQKWFWELPSGPKSDSEGYTTEHFVFTLECMTRQKTTFLRTNTLCYATDVRALRAITRFIPEHMYLRWISGFPDNWFNYWLLRLWSNVAHHT